MASPSVLLKVCSNVADLLVPLQFQAVPVLSHTPSYCTKNTNAPCEVVVAVKVYVCPGHTSVGPVIHRFCTIPNIELEIKIK
jgi:hypothetical protein